MLNIAFTERGDTFPKSVTSFCNNVVLSNVAKRNEKPACNAKGFHSHFRELISIMIFLHQEFLIHLIIRKRLLALVPG